MSEKEEGADKVVLPELPTEVGPGFLSSYWTSETALPRMTPWEFVRYFVGHGVHNVLAIPLSTAITVSTIAIALFILGGFLLILQNIDRSLSNTGSRYEVIAYLKEDVADDVLTTFLKELEQSSGVVAVRYVSKEDALTEFQEELGEDAPLLQGLAGVNPLPASLEIRIRESEESAELANRLVNDLGSAEVVEEVTYASEWVEQSQALLRLFRFVGVCALITVLLIVVFLISNTIRLVIFMRRSEISIMLLVGASDDAIRIPFMIGGLLQGLVGSLLGLACLRLAYLLIVAQLESSPVLAAALPRVSFLSGFTVSATLLLGAGVGCLGSLFALKKFMRV